MTSVSRDVQTLVLSFSWLCSKQVSDNGLIISKIYFLSACLSRLSRCRIPVAWLYLTGSPAEGSRRFFRLVSSCLAHWVRRLEWIFFRCSSSILYPLLLSDLGLIGSSKKSISTSCSTSLTLTSTIWVRSTIKPFTVHSRSSVLLLNICNIDFSLKNLGMPRTEPRAAGREARSSVPSKCVGRMRQGF